MRSTTRGSSASDETRRLLLLQNAAFLPLFRASNKAAGRLDHVGARPESTATARWRRFSPTSAATGSPQRAKFSRICGSSSPQPFADTARRLIFLKGSNSHDYKFSSAVLEDYAHLSPPWRDRVLAASVFNLRGSATTTTNS